MTKEDQEQFNYEKSADKYDDRMELSKKNIGHCICPRCLSVIYDVGYFCPKCEEDVTEMDFELEREKWIECELKDGKIIRGENR